MSITPRQQSLLAALVLARLTDWQYGAWPGDDVVREMCDLYHVLAPSEGHVTVEWLMERRPVHWSDRG